MSDFTVSELRRLDLTLLLVFLGLARHRKALAVASELGLTQSAISQALRRLREVFGDELFLRRPHGMEPTATALALEPSIAAAVEALRGALGSARAFDPDTATGVLRIAALDAEQAVMIPFLAARVSRSAPGLQLSVLNLGRADAVEALVTSRVDLAFGYIWDRPDSIHSAGLYEECYSVVGPDTLLSASSDISLDDYCRSRHILVSPGGDLTGVVDRTLADLGRNRRVVLAMPSFLPALAASAHMGALVTMPSRVARFFSAGFGLVANNPPFRIRNFTISMYWHQRNDNDSKITWTRELVSSLCRPIPCGYP